MPSNALKVFDDHLTECDSAIVLYDHLDASLRFSADFNLRFVWVASVSALDHYLTQLILERATLSFSNGSQLTAKLQSEVMTFASAIEFRAADPVRAVLLFRQRLNEAIRFRSFQSPDSISDGLAYIWEQKHKWKEIGATLGGDAERLKRTLSAIVARRNLIVHNGDFDEGLGAKLPVKSDDAKEVVRFLRVLVHRIDQVVV